MNLTAAIAEAKARGFDYLSDPRVTIALNNAKNAFEDFADWPWLEQTTTGTAPLSISDLKAVLYVVDATNGNELQGLDARDIVDRDAVTTTAGVPAYWWIDGENTLRTYPTQAGASLSVRYLRYSPELSAPTDTPLIPARYHPIWIDLTAVELAKDDEDFQDVQLLVQDTTRRLQQIANTYATRNRQDANVQVIAYGSEDW